MTEEQHQGQATSMNNQHEEMDLALILNNPTDYSEEELTAFFADAQNRSDYMAVKLACQAERRAMTPVPDVDKEWEQFSEQHFAAQKEAINGTADKHARLKYLLAALGGAAAMLLAMLAYQHLMPKEEIKEQFIAMEYDDSPQNITMSINGKEEKAVAPLDSISFFKRSSESYTAQNQRENAAAPSGTRTLKTPRGMDLKVILPDGSEVWLNAESSLEFPTSFAQKRDVILNGEAYFKIARDEKKPFIVSTDKMNVKVLGTEFNFRHYPTERTQVSLVKGSVEILNTDNTPTAIILQPGQGANIDKQGIIHVQQVDTYAVTQWTDGFFYFQNQTLVTALQEIGRWYNVGVVFENTEVVNEKIHFSALRKETLQQTLDKLNQLLHTHITSKGNKIIVK
ncbi:MAG: FecR domain-containing protein [Prevotella sp.]|nr:FecR domain-containing protein [Prevotella sp.]